METPQERLVANLERALKVAESSPNVSKLVAAFRLALKKAKKGIVPARKGAALKVR